jgi:glucose/arabinose dehydrogenase
MRSLHRSALAVAAALLLAGCASADATAPDWRPKPSFQGEGAEPGGPPPAAEPTPGQLTPSGPRSPTPRPSTSGQQDPAVVATHLRAPVGLTLLPDGTALVGERTTGRIVQVQPQPGKPVRTVRTLTGLDTRGDGGLLDLALSPNYSQDNLIFAYVTTGTDNRVVVFTLHGPVTPVFTGIPKGRTGNAGRIAFDSAGNLYIGTGDVGRPRLATNASSLAGKVLRVSDIGRPAAGNPTPGSAVFTSGHQVADGLCWDRAHRQMLLTEPAAGAAELNLLQAGASYGWPSAPRGSRNPIARLPSADGAPGGCAVLDGTVFVTSRDGEVLLASHLESTRTGLRATPWRSALKHKYGRLRTVVAAPDGALWLTTANRDGHGSPVPADERVLRIVPSGGGNQDEPL